KGRRRPRSSQIRPEKNSGQGMTWRWLGDDSSRSRSNDGVSLNCQPFFEQRYQNLHRCTILHPTVDFFLLDLEAHVPKKVAVCVNEMRVHQPVFLRAKCVGQQAAAAVSCGRKQRARKETKVEQGVHLAKGIDGFA